MLQVLQVLREQMVAGEQQQQQQKLDVLFSTSSAPSWSSPLAYQQGQERPVLWEQMVEVERKRQRHGLRVIFVLARQGSLWQPDRRFWQLAQWVAGDQGHPS